jgi:uncharacterized protein (TIGR02246 family)
MKPATITLSVMSALAGAVFAQDPAAKKPAAPPAEPPPAAEAAPAPSAEATAVAAVDRAYEAAFAKGDAKAIAALFTEDAEFTSDDGRTVSGRAAIETMSRAAFQSNKGATLAIDSGSVRLLAPGVAVQKGSTSVTGKDGETSGALFTAVLVEQDGKWKYSQVIETPQADIAPGERLSELSWLVGDWQETDKSSGLTIRSKFDWAKGGNFMTRNVTVKQGEEVQVEGWQIIGWDPLEERIRSWTFDTEGGWSAGIWVRDGKRWLVREEGVTPDGERTAADNTITQVSEDKLTWESYNRTIDGTPQPSLDKIEINRVKGD